MKISRRRLIRQGRDATLVTCAAALPLLHGSKAFANTLDVRNAPLHFLDPARAVDDTYDMLRSTLFDLKMAKIAVERSWKAYNDTGEQKYGEWAALYCFSFWRMTPLGDKRVQVARIGKKLSEQYRGDFPKLAAGHFWTATFLGLEAVSRGILDAAHLIPQYQANLAVAEEIDYTYFYGAPLVAQAKLFIKAPKFPISIGNMNKGLEYLERARPIQEKVFAMWYVFKAEADYLTAGKEKAYATLAKMQPNVTPVDAATQFAYEMSLQDAQGFKQAIESGTYNKYSWDPLLTRLVVPK